MSQSEKRKPGRRRKGEKQLSKSEIVEATLKLIDRDGIEAFSMRHLAAELGVYPTALYWHIKNRNALLGDVVSMVLADLLPEDFEDDWRQGIVNLCRNYRERIKAHPSMAPVVGSQLVSNTSLDFPMIERILAALEGAGFKGASLRAAYNTVLAAMVSFTTQEFARLPADATDSWVQDMKDEIRGVDPQRFPTIARNLPELENRSFILRWENGSTSPLDDGFEHYVHSIVAGLEASLRSQ
ncbi:TetR family transcriptional regulator [Marinovum sp. 2_MG-2023]|uniref:TetR/AcrR family transcriptional regulator n=1 Tax=unclassified Marinovum TaxID=2647166 RepID=UPI0026E33D5B|nr:MULTISPECIES: TetR family transcriptional regulator [unclassified Marinovum]MDO6729057.1 TetR family transcriptional regulator [Marinovum sp. 2_MG-2023]MDO6779316.1 TetR family transcriptional regulator [Marinovum sp. 1_MG-2023]